MTKHTRRLIATAAIPAALALALAGCSSGGPTAGLTKDVIAGDWTCAAGTAVGGQDSIDFYSGVTLSAGDTYDVHLGDDKKITVEKKGEDARISGKWSVIDAKDSQSGKNGVALDASFPDYAAFEVQLPQKLTASMVKFDGGMSDRLSGVGFTGNIFPSKVVASASKIEFKVPTSGTTDLSAYLPVSCTR